MVMYVSIWPWNMWDLSSLTRDQMQASCTGRWNLNHWITRAAPGLWGEGTVLNKETEQSQNMAGLWQRVMDQLMTHGAAHYWQGCISTRPGWTLSKLPVWKIWVESAPGREKKKTTKKQPKFKDPQAALIAGKWRNKKSQHCSLQRS